MSALPSTRTELNFSEDLLMLEEEKIEHHWTLNFGPHKAMRVNVNMLFSGHAWSPNSKVRSPTYPWLSNKFQAQATWDLVSEPQTNRMHTFIAYSLPISLLWSKSHVDWNYSIRRTHQISFWNISAMMAKTPLVGFTVVPKDLDN